MDGPAQQGENPSQTPARGLKSVFLLIGLGILAVGASLILFPPGKLGSNTIVNSDEAFPFEEPEGDSSPPWKPDPNWVSSSGKGGGNPLKNPGSSPSRKGAEGESTPEKKGEFPHKVEAKPKGVGEPDRVFDPPTSPHTSPPSETPSHPNPPSTTHRPPSASESSSPTPSHRVSSIPMLRFVPDPPEGNPTTPPGTPPGTPAIAPFFTCSVLSLGTQAPITGARVTVLIPPHGKVRGITAGNGNAVFQLPHEFEGRFVVSADGFRGTYRYVTSQNPNPTRSLMVPLEPAPPEEIRTIRLTDGKTGTALSGVTLIFDDGFLSSWGTTDAQGVEGVPTGLFRLPFYVQAQFGGYHPLRGVISSLETPVEHAFVMVPETPMNLTCRTPEGFPVPGASVRFQPAGDGWEGEAVTVSTDTEGRAVFTGFPLSTGTRLVLSAQRAGFTPVSKTFTLEEFLQSNGVLSLQMAYSHVFQGSVRDFGQWATSPLTVEYYFPPASNPLFRPDSAQDLSRAVAVGPGGTFSINGPGPGAVRVRLRRGDEVLHIGDVPVQA
ncbi:MAG: carboxypeptidase-like regulatory domain-containing protein, partial [Planctomycetota bacterium]